MSQSSIENFFPFSSRVMKLHLPGLWSAIFPPESAATCPSVHSFRVPIPGAQFDVRWPVLALACVFGAVYGALIGFSILQKKQIPDPGRYSWGMAFLFYACMSATGLLYHCLLQEETIASGLAYAGDTAFTACSCISIAIGGLVDTGLLSDASSESIARPTGVQAIHLLLSGVTITAVFSCHALGIDAVPDQLYVQGVALAGLFAVVLQLLQPRWLVNDRLRAVAMPEAPKRILLCSGSGMAVLLAVAALMDRHLCRWLGSANFSLTSLGFWAFNSGMVGLEMYYRAARGYRLQRHKVLMKRDT